MPKKQSKEVSNIKLRRSKPAPVKTPEYLTDEEEICLEADPQEDAPQEVSPQDVEFEEPQRKPKTQHSTSSTTAGSNASKPKPKKPKAQRNVTDFKSEREAFQQYVNEQRELLAKERMEHLEQIKQESVKEKAKNAANDARMRLMSIL